MFTNTCTVKDLTSHLCAGLMQKGTELKIISLLAGFKPFSIFRTITSSPLQTVSENRSIHPQSSWSTLWCLLCKLFNHMSKYLVCMSCGSSEGPSGSYSTFCRSAMACFRFLACSYFSCRTMSCFFRSRRRMI